MHGSHGYIYSKYNIIYEVNCPLIWHQFNGLPGLQNKRIKGAGDPGSILIFFVVS